METREAIEDAKDATQLRNILENVGPTAVA